MAGIEATLVLSGIEELRDFLEQLGPRAMVAVGQGLYQGGNEAMNASQAEVPVGGPPTSPYDKHPGALKSTGHVAEPDLADDVVSVTLSYGDVATPYARRQHEELDWRHKPGQKAKYLEDPVVAIATNGRVAELVVLAVRRAVMEG